MTKTSTIIKHRHTRIVAKASIEVEVQPEVTDEALKAVTAEELNSFLSLRNQRKFQITKISKVTKAEATTKKGTKHQLALFEAEMTSKQAEKE